MKYGKLTKYDNNFGIILDDKGTEYKVLKKDIKYNNIKTDDYVKFYSEKFITANEDHNMARFVNKLTLKK